MSSEVSDFLAWLESLGMYVYLESKRIPDDVRQLVDQSDAECKGSPFIPVASVGVTYDELMGAFYAEYDQRVGAQPCLGVLRGLEEDAKPAEVTAFWNNVRESLEFRLKKEKAQLHPP